MTRRSSFGSITRMGRDTWRLRWWADTPEGRRRVSETVRGTKRDAEHRLAEVHVGVGVQRGGCPTVGYVYERLWLPDASARVAPNTMRMYRSSWAAHCRDRWARVPLSEVRRIDVQDWLLSKSYSVACAAKTLLKQVGDAAVLYDLHGSNPFAFAARLPKNESPRDKGVYTLDGLLSVALAARGTAIEAAVILAGLGSCRVGESLGVRCDEVRPMEAGGVRFAVADIGRQVDNNTGELVDSLKTRQSARQVLLPERVGDRLLDIAAERLAVGDPWLVGDGTGAPMDQRGLRACWRGVVDAAGVEYIDFRNLRNSWETAMRHEAGVPPHVIEPLMGHSGKGVTAMYYDRPSTAQLAAQYAEAYAARPFARDWGKK